MSPNSTSIFSWKKGLLVFLVIGVLTGCASILWQTHREILIGGSLVGEPSSVPAVVPTASAAGLGSSFNAPGLPVRLVIPAIGVDAAIQDVGMSWSGVNIGVPTNFTDVGWFKYSALPGAPGTAIIDGHLDGKYVPQAVFYNLQKLNVGDAVNIIDTSGTILQFQVVASKVYDYNASTTDIFAMNATGTRLDLITCAGDWLPGQKSYNQRIVVFTQLVTTN
jgi:hypothetical protein